MPQIQLRPMTLSDLDRVTAIDRACFPTPWPREAFLYELQREHYSICWVAEWIPEDGGPVIAGVILIWLTAVQAHIGTLAVDPAYRQQGIGQHLLANALIECEQRGVQQVVLEVRRSNERAQKLYQKFSFTTVGLINNYYQDTHEDAMLMRLASLNQEKLADLADYG